MSYSYFIYYLLDKAVSETLGGINKCKLVHVGVVNNNNNNKKKQQKKTNNNNNNKKQTNKQNKMPDYLPYLDTLTPDHTDPNIKINLNVYVSKIAGTTWKIIKYFLC